EADAALRAALRDDDVLVRSKADLGAEPAEHQRVSVVTGEGLADLEATLLARVVAALGSNEAPALTRVRHRRPVEEARIGVERARQSLASGAELAAEDLRSAAQSLGRLTGRVDVEDLLDEIFSSFCIGK